MRRAAFVLSTCVVLGGCAIGKTSAGGYVLGVDVPGGAPESASDGFAAAASAIPGIVAQAATGGWVDAFGNAALATATVVAGIFGVRKAAQAAELRGKEKGWTEAVGTPAVAGEAQIGGAA